MKDVDTDMIIPAQYLTQISKTGYGDHVFARLRQADKNFAFNLNKYKNAQILLSGSNFGCGSSREHAVWALQQAGIQAIIASSYSDIFAGNAAKNGLLLISLEEEKINMLLTLAQNTDIVFSINLEKQTVHCQTTEQTYHFDYDPFRKECLLKGQDDLDFLIAHVKEINDFKDQQINF